MVLPNGFCVLQGLRLLTALAPDDDLPLSFGASHRLVDELTMPEELAKRPPSPRPPASAFTWLAALGLQGQRTRCAPSNFVSVRVSDLCYAHEGLRALAVAAGRRTDDADLELVALAAIEALCGAGSHEQIMRHSACASDPTGLVEAVVARRTFLWSMARSPCDLELPGLRAASGALPTAFRTRRAVLCHKHWWDLLVVVANLQPRVSSEAQPRPAWCQMWYHRRVW